MSVIRLKSIAIAVSLVLGTGLFPLSSPAQTADAGSIALYFFRNGAPINGAELVVGNEVLARTDNNGALHVDLPAGDYEAVIRKEGVDLQTLKLTVAAGEQKQLIITQPEEGEEVKVDVESSHGEAPVATGGEDQGPVGTVFGVITSIESGVPVPGAKIYLGGVRGYVETDADGRYTWAVPVGIYNLSVVHPDYSTQTFNELEITAGASLVQDAELTPSGLELGEFVVNAPYLEGGVLALAEEQRESTNVTEVLGADQMSKSGDSDAADALKRVTGLTLVGGKYIYVRGLGERYASTTLNGLGIPSPDPTRRVVPLDLFPTGVLGSVAIQKTYSPDLPGDFSGGVIQLRTKGLPEEKVRNISISTGGNSQSTFQEGLTYDGGSTDYLGVDDGTRDLPAGLSSGSLPSDPDELEALGESLPQTYNTETTTLPPDFSFKGHWANRNEQYQADWGWGYNLALEYGNKWRYEEEQDNTYNVVGDELALQNAFTNEQTENQIKLGGIGSVAFELGENHKLEGLMLLTRDTTNTVLYEKGYLAENDRNVEDTTLEWVERQLFSLQAHGAHTLVSLNDAVIDWHLAYSNARRYEPDTRTYRYAEDQNGELNLSSAGDSNESSWEDLTDDIYSFAANFTYPIYDFFSRQAQLKGGLAYESRQRTSELLRYELELSSFNNVDLTPDDPEDIFTDDNIDSNGFFLTSNTQNTDNYEAKQIIQAAYVMGDFELTDTWRMMTGARLESIYQEIITQDLAAESSQTSAKLESTDLLPALSLTWAVAEDKQVRFAASQTLNRPDLKELSEAPYTDPETRTTIIGNPDLQQASIVNLDLRWEWYVTRFETLQMAAFYKQFDQPIEQIRIPGNNVTSTFANAEAARNLGVELQSRFWLSRFAGPGWASRFFLETNLAFIDSEVSLGDAGSFLTTDNRPLQGQSPYVVNVNLGYENLVTSTEAMLLYNIAGERIVEVGAQGLPDAYEQPAPQLDFVYKTQVYEGAEDKMDFSFKLDNLLDPRHEVLRGDEVEQAGRKGISVSLGLKYKWK